jgi:hypothetical protein
VPRLQSGILFVIAGIVLNAIGRMFVVFAGRSQTVVGSGAVFLAMFASVVLVVLGLYRIVTGGRRT